MSRKKGSKNNNNTNNAGANNFAQMIYYQNSIASFTRPFIQNNRDTLRWLMDIRIYASKYSAVPPNMVYNKILDSISPRQQLLYDQWFQTQIGDADGQLTQNIESLKNWVKYQYKPPKSVDFMYDALRAIKHRPEEDPVLVFNKWAVMAQTIALCIEIINENDEENDIPTVLPFTDRMKYTSLNRIFVVDNNIASHGTRGRVNAATKKYIIKDPAPRTLEEYILRINELHNHLQPAILGKTDWNKYTTYVPDDIQSILFGHSIKNRPVNPEQKQPVSARQQTAEQLIIFASRGEHNNYAPHRGRGGRGTGRGNRYHFARGRGGFRGGRGRNNGVFGGRRGRGGPRGRGGRGGARRDRGGRGNGRGRNNKRYRDPSFGDNTDNKRARYDTTCHRCGKRGHFKKDCHSVRHINGSLLTPKQPQQQSQRQQQPPINTIKRGACYRCGRKNHFRKDCTALRTIDGKPIYDTLSIDLAAKKANNTSSAENTSTAQQPNRPRPFGQWNNNQ